MRISDWSSDVCSSDLLRARRRKPRLRRRIFRLGLRKLRRKTRQFLLRDRAGLGNGEKIVRGAIVGDRALGAEHLRARSEEHTSELQSLMRISYDVFCFKKKKLIKCHTL